MSSSSPSKAYVLLGCPFCFKFLLFMTEAGLLNEIDIVSYDKKQDDYEEKKLALAEATQAMVSFPMAEIEPGHFLADSDGLIQYYAEKHSVAIPELPILECYTQGVFNGLMELYMENIELKKKLA